MNNHQENEEIWVLSHFERNEFAVFDGGVMYFTPPGTDFGRSESRDSVLSLSGSIYHQGRRSTQQSQTGADPRDW